MKEKCTLRKCAGGRSWAGVDSQMNAKHKWVTAERSHAQAFFFRFLKQKLKTRSLADLPPELRLAVLAAAQLSYETQRNPNDNAPQISAHQRRAARRAV